MPSSYLALLRIPILISTSIAVHIGQVPPNPPPAADERNRFDSHKGFDLMKLLKGGVLVAKTLNAIMDFVFLCETYIIISSLFPSFRLPPNIHALFYQSCVPNSSISPIGLTPTFLIGAAFINFGGYYRLWCYRALGRYFTFQLSIRRDHKLITNGPYAFVRHPAYLGSSFMYPGLILTLVGHGSWFSTCGVQDAMLDLGFMTLPLGKIMYFIWISLYAFA
ncbi:Protein-S-isoprenylcysteine O-methyltransferase, partial [Abortiporus biennis]